MADETKAASAEAKTAEKVTLKKHHIHRGKECKPGDKITLRRGQVERLRKQGVV